MDEVKTMAHAGETVGRAVGTGLRTLRRGAEQVAAAAEQKLSDGLDAANEARTMAADARTEVVGTSRKARKQLAREAKLTAKELTRSAQQVRKTARTALAVPGDLVSAATPKQRRRRKWPWLLGLGIAVAGAGAAYVLKSRQEPPTQPAEPVATPEPRREEQVDGRPAPVHNA